MSIDRDAASIKYNTSIVSVVGDRVDLKEAGSKHMGCCPFHDDRTPSLSVDDGDGSGSGGWYYCFGCGASGDVFDFLQRYHGVNFLTALRMLGGDPTVPTWDLHQRPTRTKDKQKWVERIWEHREAIAASSPAGDYLSNRGIPLDELGPLPNLGETQLEYRGDDQEHPVLLAAVRDGEDHLVGIQRTYLTKNGRKLPVDIPKMSLGKIRGGAIKIGEDTQELTICEGLEDALSLKYARPDATVWAAAGGNMLSSLPVPDTCTKLIIAQDNDEAGRRAAKAAVTAYRRRGREVLLISPSPEFKDFNEELMASAIV